MRLYSRAEEKVENELDICYIIKTLKNLDIFMRNNSLNKQVKFEIEHSKLHLINLDEESWSDSDEEEASSSDDENKKSMFEEAGIKGKGTTKVGSEGSGKYAVSVSSEKQNVAAL